MKFKWYSTVLLLIIIQMRPCSATSEHDQKEMILEKPLIISTVSVEGNDYVPTSAILNCIPFKKGVPFDPEQSSTAIKNVYSLGYFEQVSVEHKKIKSQNSIHVFIRVREKLLLQEITITGNKALKEKVIREKLGLDKIAAINKESAIDIARGIKKLYVKENHHNVKVKARLVKDRDAKRKASLHFTIQEGPKAIITRVHFKGNNHVADHKLAGVLYTREDWLFSFLNEAGKFDEEQCEMDKRRIEYFYRDLGYLEARVVDTDILFSPNKRALSITFAIKEGPKYTVRSVQALGDEFFTDKTLIQEINITAGESFAQSKIIAAINKLKALWGKKGYIYADVYPQIKPDKEQKTVDLIFHIERGEKLQVNRINITGNTTTRDKVIRRELTFEEGEWLTTEKLAQSQNNVEYLGYFARGGVNWKIHRLSDLLADLELNVREHQTGQGSLSATYGSERGSPTRSFKVMLQVEKRNLFGMGWDTRLMLRGDRRRFRRFEFQFLDPYLFDTNTSGEFSFYIKREDYDQWTNVTPTPREKTIGGHIRIGYLLPKFDKRLFFFTEYGIESLSNNKPQAIGQRKELLQPLIDRNFQDGTLQWIGFDVIKDLRNHKVYPNRGYKISLMSRFAPSLVNTTYSMAKAELDLSWYTPLIGEDDLVLALHARGGMIRTFGSNREIPYKELFHMGGQGTVRGFRWGAIGPTFTTGSIASGSPLGGRNALQFNAELIFPLLQDYSMKGHFFYDAGASWDTPKKNIPNQDFIKRDKFNLRHAIGLGINLIYPQAVKIDWGYKLDRDTDSGEARSEWHISMNIPW